MTRMLKGMVVQILKVHSLEYSRVGNRVGCSTIGHAPLAGGF